MGLIRKKNEAGDVILREINKIGELILAIATRLGLFKDSPEGFDIDDIQRELDKSGIALRLDELLDSDAPLVMLVDQLQMSHTSLELLCQMLYESDRDSVKVKRLISEVIDYQRRDGYFSFILASIPID